MPGTASSKRVLWVDDESPRKRRLLRRLREHLGEDNLLLGRTVEEAENYLMGDLRIDCILLDIMLPQDDLELANAMVRLDAGIEILRQLKSGAYSAAPQGTPVIVITARGNEEAIVEIRRLLVDGSDHLIRKPSSTRTVLETVARTLA